MTKRFSAFTDEQAEQLRAQEINDVHRVMVVLALLVVALAIGFGYGLKRVADASDRADSANRAVAALNRERSVEAKTSARKAAESAYAACRRQQESQPITRDFFHLIRDLSLTVRLDREFRKLHDELVASKAFDVPKCVKPPKGTS